MLSKKILILTTTILILALAGCTGIAAPNTVKVAVSLPLGLEIGKDMLNGVQLALDQANGQAGNINVELQVFDTSDPNGSPVSPEFEQDAATQAAADEAVVAYLGPAGSDQARQSMPILNQAGIVQVSPSVTWPGLTKPGFGPGEPGVYYPTGRRHFFRVIPSDDIQGNVAANWASSLGFESVYILDDSSTYGQGVAGIFTVATQDLGLEIMAVDSYDATVPQSPEELQAIANRIAEAQPDLLYFGGTTEQVNFELVGIIRQANPELPIMVPDGLVQAELITTNPVDLIQGIYGTSVIIPVGQLASAADFSAAYQNEYNKKPDPFVLSSYEAMKVILAAIEQANSPTRQDVLTAVAELGEFSGVLGTWSFDANGDISLTRISGMQIQNDSWEFVQVIQ